MAVVFSRFCMMSCRLFMYEFTPCNLRTIFDDHYMQGEYSCKSSSDGPYYNAERFSKKFVQHTLSKLFTILK